MDYRLTMVHKYGTLVYGLNYGHWIGLRGNLNWKPLFFPIKYGGFRFQFARKPIQWLWLTMVYKYDQLWFITMIDYGL